MDFRVLLWVCLIESQSLVHSHVSLVSNGRQLLLREH
jgi:hypothetical protein